MDKNNIVWIDIVQGVATIVSITAYNTGVLAITYTFNGITYYINYSPSALIFLKYSGHNNALLFWNSNQCFRLKVSNATISFIGDENFNALPLNGSLFDAGNLQSYATNGLITGPGITRIDFGTNNFLVIISSVTPYRVEQIANNNFKFIMITSFVRNIELTLPNVVPSTGLFPSPPSIAGSNIYMPSAQNAAATVLDIDINPIANLTENVTITRAALDLMFPSQVGKTYSGILFIQVGIPNVISAGVFTGLVGLHIVSQISQNPPAAGTIGGTATVNLNGNSTQIAIGNGENSALTIIPVPFTLPNAASALNLTFVITGRANGDATNPTPANVEYVATVINAVLQSNT